MRKATLIIRQLDHRAPTHKWEPMALKIRKKCLHSEPLTKKETQYLELNNYYLG